jgi:hypothetical protein
MNSNEGNKSKERVIDKNLTMGHLKDVFDTYKDHQVSHADLEHTSKVKQGNKTQRSSGTNGHKKKGTYKLNAIYKQLCEKVKVLQTTSQKLFDKNQRIKEYELKLKAELQARENIISKREQMVNQVEKEFTLRNNMKTDDIFPVNQNTIKNEYNDIIQQLRSMDTQKHDDTDFANQEDKWRPNDRIRSIDLFRNESIDDQHPDLLKSLEPDEYHFANIDTRYAQNIDQAEMGTYMTLNKLDASINAIKEMKTIGAQVSSISQNDIDRIAELDKEHKQLSQRKQEFESHMIHEHSILDKRKLDQENRQTSIISQIDQFKNNIAELESTVILYQFWLNSAYNIFLN